MSRSAVCAVVLLVITLVDFSSAGNVELIANFRFFVDDDDTTAYSQPSTRR